MTLALLLTIYAAGYWLLIYRPATNDTNDTPEE